MGPFVKNQHKVGTKVWVATIDNLRIIGTIKGYRERDGDVVGMTIQRQDDSIVELEAREISAIFDV